MTQMDITLRLRELRRLHGLSQKEVARRSGVGEKTLSSFETGERTDAMKVRQLEEILAVYSVPLSAFFGTYVERRVPEWELDTNSDAAPTPLQLLFLAITDLPEPAQRSAIAACSMLVKGASRSAG
jgi:transcriptional regulator with XRE-family HTH domain